MLDGNEKPLTLGRLQNQAFDDARDDAAREAIRAEMRARRVDGRSKKVVRTIEHLRQQVIAHLDREAATNRSADSSHSRIGLADHRDLAGKAHELINAVGMTTEYMTFYPEYDSSVKVDGRPSRPDVELPFDEMVARCGEIRMPEEKPIEFQFHWNQRGSRQRAEFNGYRPRLGLPEVPTSS